MPPVRPGGVEVDGVDSREIGLLGVVQHHLGLGERGEVVAGDRRGDLVALDRPHRKVECRHREGVRPDAASEIGDPGCSGVAEAAGVQGGDLQPGGLLESCRRVQEPVGEGAELVPGLLAQP